MTENEQIANAYLHPKQKTVADEVLTVAQNPPPNWMEGFMRLSNLLVLLKDNPQDEKIWIEVRGHAEWWERMKREGHYWTKFSGAGDPQV